LDLVHRIPAFKATHSVDQSIPSGTLTALIYDTDISVSDSGIHSTTVNNSRATINQPGIYAFFCNARWEALNAIGRRQLTIYKNGVQTARVATTEGAAVQTTMIQLCIGFDYCISGDYYESAAYQDSGVAIKILGNTTANDFLKFWGVFLGR